ncbi:MAG: ATP-binding protein [Veillonellales bacterium]
MVTREGVTRAVRLLLPRTLSRRLWVWGILLMVVPSLLILTAFSLGQVKAERSRIMVQMEQQLAMQQQILQALVNRHSAQIRSIAQSYDTRTYDAAAMKQNFRAALENEQQFHNICYVNRNGIVTVDTRYPSGLDIHDREFVKTAQMGSDHITDLTISRASDMPRMVFSSPVYNSAGEFNGVIVGTVDMGMLSSIVNQFPLHETCKSYLVHRLGSRLIKTEPSGKIGESGQPEYFKISETVHSVGIDNVLEGKSGVATYINDRGLKVIGAYRWLEDLNWGLVCEIEEQQALLPGIVGLLKMALCLSAVFLLALPLSLMMVKSINQPIASLLYASEQLKTRKYNYRISEREISAASLEFEQLFRTLNQAASALQNNQERLKTIIKARTSELQQEINVRKKAEAALRQHEQELTTLLENTPDIISRFDRSLRFVYVNPAIYVQTGISHTRFIGKTSREIGLTESYCAYWEKNLQAIFETGEPKELIFEYNTPRGQRTYNSRVVPEFAGDGSIQTLLRITRDITERRQMEKEMARFDRLDLVGEMAASIGHEVRNPMTTVRGFLQMLGRKNKDSRQAEYFNLMISELDRANSIISEFLSLAKNKAVNLQEMNLDKVVRALHPLIKADAMLKDKNVAVDLASLPAILADEKEIRQLILNLARNGLEAMMEHGTLTIKTFAEKNDVVLAVQDEGPGIPAEVVDKLGTPFFTTKEQGTGLGLAVCYSIANRHGATIELDTGPEGTTFYIRFPVYKLQSSPA